MLLSNHFVNKQFYKLLIIANNNTMSQNFVDYLNTKFVKLNLSYKNLHLQKKQDLNIENILIFRQSYFFSKLLTSITYTKHTRFRRKSLKKKIQCK